MVNWSGSYTMLTINADDHDMTMGFHKPTDEKRMVVGLPRDLYTDWLSTKPLESMGLMRQFPAEQLRTT